MCVSPFTHISYWLKHLKTFGLLADRKPLHNTNTKANGCSLGEVKDNNNSLHIVLFI
jgi:hypothetical protein